MAKKAVGRLELLNWVNDFLEVDYAKIEEFSDGIAYCQLFDALFPGKFPLWKVNFNSRFEDENLKNLQLLQDSFKKLGVQMEVPVQKLVKGKFADNNEFLQWCFFYVQKHYPSAASKYKALDRRLEAQAKAAKQAGIPFRPNMKHELLPNQGIDHEMIKRSLAAPYERVTSITSPEGGSASASTRSAKSLDPLHTIPHLEQEGHVLFPGSAWDAHHHHRQQQQQQPQTSPSHSQPNSRGPSAKNSPELRPQQPMYSLPDTLGDMPVAAQGVRWGQSSHYQKMLAGSGGAPAGGGGPKKSGSGHSSRPTSAMPHETQQQQQQQGGHSRHPHPISTPPKKGTSMTQLSPSSSQSYQPPQRPAADRAGLESRERDREPPRVEIKLEIPIAQAELFPPSELSTQSSQQRDKFAPQPLPPHFSLPFTAQPQIQAAETTPISSPPQNPVLPISRPALPLPLGGSQPPPPPVFDILEIERLIDELQADLSDRLHEHGQIMSRIKTAQKERNFYFDKLRSIEMVCELHESTSGKTSGALREILSERPPEFDE